MNRQINKKRENNGESRKQVKLIYDARHTQTIDPTCLTFQVSFVGALKGSKRNHNEEIYHQKYNIFNYFEMNF